MAEKKTRTLPAEFTGGICPEAADYSLVHGTSAALGTVVLTGKIDPPLNKLQTIRIGASLFIGYVRDYNYDFNEDHTTIKIADWRDRLHLELVFAVFNMEEDDGRFYHIQPERWITQKRTYLTRSVKQLDFVAFQAFPGHVLGPGGVKKYTVNNIAIGTDKLFSSWSLLTWLADQYNYKLTGEAFAIGLLKRTYPISLDWNGGVTVAEAVQSILDQSNMQFTCFGTDIMHITIRGFTDVAFSNAIAAGLVLPCIRGAHSAAIGKELNELGRHVVILGEPNKYEWVYPCRQNWPESWTWKFCYEGVTLNALLKSLGLTRLNKVKELPVRFHDNETWIGSDDMGKGFILDKRTRNDMTIEEYLEKIPFKTYVVDFREAFTFLNLINKEGFGGSTTRLLVSGLPTGFAAIAAPQLFAVFPVETGGENKSLNSQFPISQTLVSDSFLQFVCYGTSRKAIRGNSEPVSEQYGLVPINSGVNLNVEEVLDVGSGRNSYRCRLFFSEPQVWINNDKEFGDPEKIATDRIAVRLSIDGGLYRYQQGDPPGKLRVRSTRHTVRNLYKGFVEGSEVAVLFRNFIRDIENVAGPVVGQEGILADDMAKYIAQQLLFYKAITTSGFMQWFDRCGHKPDGLIDNVVVRFTDNDGIEETINFTDAFKSDTRFTVFQFRFSKRQQFEEELVRERIIALGRAAMKDASFAMRAATITGSGMYDLGALHGAVIPATVFGRDGAVLIKYPAQTIESHGQFVPHTIVALDKKIP